MTTPDTTTPEATTDENAASAATTVVEAEPAAPETTSEAQAGTEAPAAENAEAPVAEKQAAPALVETAAVTEQAAPAAEVAPAEVATAVAAPAAEAAVEEEEPQTTVFSLLTFFLAALPVIGVILNAIAVARAGKEGFDLWLARWGLALAIIETVGALALVGLGYYLGMLAA